MSLTLPKFPFPFNFSQTGPFLIYFILCFSPLIEGGTTYYSVAIIQFLLLFLFIGGILSFYHGSQLLNLKSALFYVMSFVLAYLTGVAFLTPYKLPAFQQVDLLLFYFVLLYFSVLFHLSQKNYRETALNLLFVMGLFESLYGMGQFVFFHQRARGTFFNPDYFGEYLAIIFCIALGLILEDGRKRSIIASETKQSGLMTLGLPRTLWALAMTNRLVDMLFLVLLGTGIVFSQSRGAALAGSVGISVVLWKRFRYGMVYAWVVLVLLFVVIPNPLQHRILKDYREDPYSLSRIEMWKEAVHMIKDRPFGIGLEMYPLISPQYAFPIHSGLQRYSKVAESPHNEYLRLFSEIGIIGGLLFMGATVFFYLKWTDKKEQSPTHYGIFGATLIVFSHALVDSNFHEPALVITTVILSTFLFNKDLFKLAIVEKINVINKPLFYSILIIFFISLSVSIVKPVTGWYFYSKGYARIKNDREDTAQFNFTKAIFWESQNARYHNALGNAYFNTFQKTNYYGWVFKALEELNQALKLNPMNGNYLKLKGEIYQALAVRERNPARIQELLDDAFTNYKEGLKLLPYDVSLYVDLGSVEEAVGQFQGAENHYNQAILIEPNYLFARERKIELLLKLGKKEAALNDYQELVSIYDRVQKLATSDTEKEFIYFNQEKLEKAVEGAK